MLGYSDPHEEQRFRPVFGIVHNGGVLPSIIHAEGVALGQTECRHHDARPAHDLPTGKSLWGRCEIPASSPRSPVAWWVTFGEQTRVISPECRSNALRGSRNSIVMDLAPLACVRLPRVGAGSPQRRRARGRRSRECLVTGRPEGPARRAPPIRGRWRSGSLSSAIADLVAAAPLQYSRPETIATIKLFDWCSFRTYDTLALRVGHALSQRATHW